MNALASKKAKSRWKTLTRKMRYAASFTLNRIALNAASDGLTPHRFLQVLDDGGLNLALHHQGRWRQVKSHLNRVVGSFGLACNTPHENAKREER